jgi:SNF2 family DNA or RNA helicase
VTLTIRPYQEEGLNFLAEHGRAALWDEPGLGKSMQSLLAMNYLLHDRARILVVSPGDAVGVWQDETEKWLGEEASVFAGMGAKATALDHQGVVVTNYHRLDDALGWGEWDGVIFDESQMLRNRNTRTLFKAVRGYFDNRRYGLHRVPAFFLSGTPIVKHTGDLWPILHLIDKKRWSSYWSFVKKYCLVWEDEHGWHVEGVTNTKALWAETASVSLRRTGVLNLPPLTRQRVRLQMTPKQYRAYKDIERDMYTDIGDSLIIAPNALAREQRLRQLLACPRILGIDEDGAALNALAALAERGSDPFVVFSPFEQALVHAEVTLRKHRRVFHVKGGMGARFRDTINAFNRAAKAGEAPVLLCTVWMGKGWSVAGQAYECFMLGVDWNDTTMTQAEKRLGRDGQKLPVYSRYFVHERSHDMDALEIISGKRRLSDVILDRKQTRRFRAGK